MRTARDLAGSRRSGIDHWQRWGITAGSAVAILLAWELFALGFPAYQFPSPGELATNLWIVVSGADTFAPGPTYGVTLLRVSIGFALALGLATLWGIAMGLRSGLGGYLAGPLFVFLTVPSVVWAFLGVVWFGLADLVVPVFVIVAIVFPYLTVTIWEGIRDLDQSLREMARSVGAGPWLRWRDVYVPHLGPYLFGATRVGIAVSWKVALVAEVFGAASGVGVVAKFHFEQFATGMVIAWAIPVMLLIYVVDRFLYRLERRTRRWQPDAAAPEVIG